MIEIENLHKSFGSKNVLRGINLKITKGETLSIIGPSGCGKSVLLKHIIGLLVPDNGSVTVEGKRIDLLSQKELYILRRKFGFLFQGAALFDSMSVEENISLPLLENDYGFSKKEISKLVSEKLEMVGLKGIEKLKPSELSGGMRKRVGLARALITSPEYMFYDEPTTGLDPIMSDNIDDLICKLSNSLNVTSVVVTHDMYSVKKIGGEVAMLHEGKVYYRGNYQTMLDTKDTVIKNFINRTKNG